MAKLAKAKTPELPVLPDTVAEDASKLLGMCKAGNLATNDYHIHRRPGEVMIVRWLEGEQVNTFYERFQAHFDVGFERLPRRRAPVPGMEKGPRSR